MRRACLLALCLLACSSRYHVRPQHLQAAQQESATTGRDVAIPALTSDRTPTYLRVGSIGGTFVIDPYGLQEVKASDSRPGLQITGYIVAGLGALLGIVGASLMMVEDAEPATSIVLIESAVFFGAGVSLLILGYSLDGPEVDRPSPGMPVTVGLPGRLALQP